MATTITRYVNRASTAGGDGTTNATAGANRAYATLKACLDAEYTARANLVTNDEVLKVVCEGTAADTLSSTYTLPSFTTDSTRYVWIIVEQANRHPGKYSTSHYRIAHSGSGIFTGNSTTTKWVFEGLQFVSTNTSGYTGIMGWGSPPAGITVELLSCVFHCTSATAPQGSTNILSITGTVARHIKMVNCVSWGNWDYGIFSQYGGANSSYTVYNNTLLGCNKGIHFDYTDNSSAIYLRNNIVQRRAGSARSAITYLSTTLDGHSCNITDDASSPNSAFRNLTCTFVDEANADLHLSASDTAALGQGTNLSADGVYAFSTDIDGDTRSLWSIGADDGQASSGILAAGFQAPGRGLVTEFSSRIGGLLEY